MNPRNRDLLADGALRLGVALSDEAIDFLVRFCDELMIWNSKVNLVRGGERDVVIRHVLDSIAAVPRIIELLGASGGTIADVGSGAGFPGIPLSIAMPDVSVTLIERSSRRASFLNSVRLLLSNPNLTVSESDARVHEKRYRVVVCRAFLPYASSILVMRRLLASDGTIVYYSAAIPATSDGETDLYRTVETLDVPFLKATRNLVVLTSRTRTSEK